MFTTEEYKKHLMEFYIRAYENNDDSRERRAREIKKNYTDKYLGQIIRDTQSFLSMLVAQMEKQPPQNGRIECVLKLPKTDQLHQYISNGCDGGWAADYLFHWGDGVISKHLVEKFFGDNFVINFLTIGKQDHQFSISGTVEEFAIISERSL